MKEKMSISLAEDSKSGYFSHKNQKLQINIVATSGNWGDGMVSSPTPF